MTEATFSDHDHNPEHQYDHAHPAPEGIGIARQGPFDPVAFEKAVGDLLSAAGIAMDTPHMGRTTQRVRELWQKRLLGGYELDPREVLGDGFEDRRTDMVVVRGIAVHGVCPHHLVPFRGVAHVAYLPNGKVVGLSKLARIVDTFARRLQVQERMTTQIADALTKKFGAAISRNAVKGRLERMKNWALRERAAAALRKMEEG